MLLIIKTSMNILFVEYLNSGQMLKYLQKICDLIYTLKYLLFPVNIEKYFRDIQETF